MKTTIDIPGPLYRRAKIRAAERGESLREVVVKALELSLDRTQGGAGDPPPQEDPLFTVNELGFPVLRAREGVVVSDELINRIREEEGI